MKKKERAILKESDAVAAQHGCRAISVLHGKKHNKVVIRHCVTGKTRFITVSKTPSDHRTTKNTMTDVRRESIFLEASHV